MSRGARELARRGVMVRRLEVIEDLGGMDVLCTDKTGTITEDRISLHACLGLDGSASAPARRLLLINAGLQTGIANPLDEAITAGVTELPQVLASVRKIDEIPYDFHRKRLSVVVRDLTEPAEQGSTWIITKGSFDTVLAVCEAGAQLAARHQPWFEQVSREGYRVLALATRRLATQSSYSQTDEQGLQLQGFALFSDRLKPGMADKLQQLRALGIQTKIVSGDNRYICAHIGAQIGLTRAPCSPVQSWRSSATRPCGRWHRAPISLSRSTHSKRSGSCAHCSTAAMRWASWAMASMMRQPCMRPMWGFRPSMRSMWPARRPIS